MATHAKYRVLVNQGKKKSVIRPPSESATKAGGTLEVKNKTNAPIFVELPAGVFIDKNGNAINTPQQVAPNADLDATIAAGAALGVYDFKVFCLETFSFAQANSDPEIIIDP